MAVIGITCLGTATAMIDSGHELTTTAMTIHAA